MNVFLVPFNEVAVALSIRCVCSWMFNLYLIIKILMSVCSTDIRNMSRTVQIKADSHVTTLMLSLHDILFQYLRYALSVLEALRCFYAAWLAISVLVEEFASVFSRSS